ncbi:MAG: phenylalanine--tRNA ligase subunit alpha, partial [Muribaculaceae bacterium]|nr:phenylalanine--tRNA ligase subunit alpha [Muribaculaceae bacterium]
MTEKIDGLMAEIAQLTAASQAEVEELRIKYLSKKGVISQLMNEFRNVPAESKRELGQKLNQLKNAATDRINGLREALTSADTGAEGLD